jgi:hypothetical protein
MPKIGSGKIEYSVAWPSEFALSPANVFRIARINDQFQINFGYVNITRLVDKFENQERSLTTDKIVESALEPVGVILTRHNFEELFQKMQDVLERIREQELQSDSGPSDA